MKIKRGLIVDASYLIQRALHVKELDELQDSKGRKTGAIFQVIRSLMYELEDHVNYYRIFCFDYHQSPRRLKLYPNYKHNIDRVVQLEEAKTNPEIAKQVAESKEFVENYHNQRAILIQLLGFLGIPCMFFENWEGDDLMYIVSRLIPESIIMTDDKDLIQLLAPNVKIARPMAKEILEYSTYQQTHHDPEMKRFLIEKAIVGDTSDNIPGACKGCGKKAAEMISEAMVANPELWREELSTHKLKKIRNFCSDESINQFNLNLELIDLSKVEIDNVIKLKVQSELESVKRPDFFKVFGFMSEYEIKEIDINSLILQITTLYNNL